ncbi:MAG: hypothetical protein ACREQ5_30365 [Candidatus Dormibacteria bacterium]
MINPSEVADMFRALVGTEIPGGCEDCLAYQTVSQDPDHSRVWHLTVHHDDTCPSYRKATP